jgi:hypothetical protein
MATLIRRHPLLAYYLLTFALSWGGFLLVVGPSRLVNTNWQAEGQFLSAIIVMLAGPSIAGLVLIGLVDGRAGYRDLFLRLKKWRVGRRWYGFAILPAPVVAAAVLFALSIPSPLVTANHKMAVVSAVSGPPSRPSSRNLAGRDSWCPGFGAVTASR